MSEWIVIKGSVVGNVDDGFTTCHAWDGHRHPTRDAAVTAGFNDYGHDDFCVGRVEGDDLTWYGWMDQPHPDEDRHEVARQLYLQAPPRRSLFGMISEFHHALRQEFGDGGATAGENRLRRRLHTEEHDELCDELDADNRVGIARELADVVYVAYGTAYSLGIDLDEVLAEVHRANMTKRDADGRFALRADGKVLKPAGFTPPDVAGIVRKRRFVPPDPIDPDGPRWTAPEPYDASMFGRSS